MTYWTNRIYLLSFLIAGYILSTNHGANSTPQLSISEYHSYTFMTKFLQNFANTYPQWANLYSIGESLGGKQKFSIDLNFVTLSPYIYSFPLKNKQQNMKRTAWCCQNITKDLLRTKTTGTSHGKHPMKFKNNFSSVKI